MRTTNEFRRQVMTWAWDFYRTALRDTFPRTFADALSGALRYLKRKAAEAASMAAGAQTSRPARFGYSPIARSLRGLPHAGTRAYRASYLTARLGC